MIILCTVVALQIFSAPAGPIIVGDVPPNEPVQIQDTSMMRDWILSVSRATTRTATISV
jgi:hypothetical protein